MGWSSIEIPLIWSKTFFMRKLLLLLLLLFQNILASSGTDGLIKIWDIRSPGQPKCVFPGHDYAVRKVRFSPYKASQLASSSYDFTVK